MSLTIIWNRFDHILSVVSTDKSVGMSGGHGLGGAHGNIKVLSSTLFPHQSCISVEGLQSRHALCMLGRTLGIKVYKHVQLVHTCPWPAGWVCVSEQETVIKDKELAQSARL